MFELGELVRVKADPLGMLMNSKLIGKTGLIVKNQFSIYTILIDGKKIDMLDIMIESMVKES